MPNFKIVVQYDGTHYKGWQVQNSTEMTIQGKLQGILEKLVGSFVEVIGSGRTDAGVHALGQVANFHMDLPEGMDEEALLLYINSRLPRDIAVISLEQVDDRFHARFSAIKKTYRYRIHVSEIANVFEKNRLYHYTDYPLHVQDMRDAARILLGEHDFGCFCGNKHFKKSTIRQLYDITINEVVNNGKTAEIVIDYTGNGFLQNMVRIMTGTLIEIGSGRRDVESIKKTLESKSRKEAGYTAPPQGLCLLSVQYKG